MAKSKQLQAEEISTASSCLYFKSEFGFVSGGEPGGAPSNRYDKLRLKLGELSASYSEVESIELNWRQRWLIGRAAKYVIGHPKTILLHNIHESIRNGNLLQQSENELQYDAAEAAYNLISRARDLVGASFDYPAADEIFGVVDDGGLTGG